MASLAFFDHLEPLLDDSAHLIDASGQLPLPLHGSAQQIAAINRATVVTAVSAWEASIEELVRESLQAIRPPSPPLGLWYVLGIAHPWPA